MSSSAGHFSSPTTAPEAEEASNLNAPLLALRQGTPDQSASLATLLGRATGQGGSSILVRETAARELQQRRADWGYSRPVVALDMMWNATFVVISVVMLAWTVDERPNTPIRIWICGYSAQCLVHIVLVWLEYRRRNGPRIRDEERPQDQAYADEGEVEEAGGGSNRFLGSSARSRCLVGFRRNFFPGQHKGILLPFSLVGLAACRR